MKKEYLTVKDFAAAANISRQAVYKALTTKLTTYVNQVDNQLKIDKQALYEVYGIEVYKVDNQFDNQFNQIDNRIDNQGGKINQIDNQFNQIDNRIDNQKNNDKQVLFNKVDNQFNRIDNQKLKVDNQVDNRRLKVARKRRVNQGVQPIQPVLNLLEKNIDQLTQELEIKNKQIEELNQRLAEAHKVAQQAQQLHGADKAKDIVLLEEDNTNKKNRWWKFWKNK